MNAPSNLEFTVIAVYPYADEEDAVLRMFKQLVLNRLGPGFDHLINLPSAVGVRRFTGDQAYSKAIKECPGAQYFQVWEQKS